MNGKLEKINEEFFEKNQKNILIESNSDDKIKEKLLEFGFEILNESEILNLILTLDLKKYCNPTIPKKQIKRKNSIEIETIKKKQKIIEKSKEKKIESDSDQTEDEMEEEEEKEVEIKKIPKEKIKIKTEEDETSEDEEIEYGKLKAEETIIAPSISIEFMETSTIEEEGEGIVSDTNESYNTTPTKKCKYNAKKFVKSLPSFKIKIKSETNSPTTTTKESEKEKENNLMKEEKEEISIQFDSDMLTYYPEDTSIFDNEEEEENDFEFTTKVDLKKKRK